MFRKIGSFFVVWYFHFIGLFPRAVILSVVYPLFAGLLYKDATGGLIVDYLNSGQIKSAILCFTVQLIKAFGFAILEFQIGEDMEKPYKYVISDEPALAFFGLLLISIPVFLVFVRVSLYYYSFYPDSLQWLPITECEWFRVYQFYGAFYFARALCFLVNVVSSDIYSSNVAEAAGYILTAPKAFFLFIKRSLEELKREGRLWSLSEYLTGKVAQFVNSGAGRSAAATASLADFIVRAAIRELVSSAIDAINRVTLLVLPSVRGVSRDFRTRVKKFIMFAIKIKRAQFSRKNFMSGLVNKRRSRATRLAAGAASAIQRPTDALRKATGYVASSVKRTVASLSSGKSGNYAVVITHIIGAAAAIIAILIIMLL